MDIKLKKVRDQVIVITGASSGIGLVTARMAAERGAKVVGAARNETALRELCDEIRSEGGHATYVDADVGREEEVREVARRAIDDFGRIDTWVNNAGVSIYGRIMDVPVDDMRRLFETNFWGVVYGSKIAVEHLRKTGGALINVGSVVSDAAVPLQGAYSASKHAMKAFTDVLRMELEDERAPISVTLIKPAAIDTPYFRHARNYLEREPQHAPPVYAPNWSPKRSFMRPSIRSATCTSARRRSSCRPWHKYARAPAISSWSRVRFGGSSPTAPPTLIAKTASTSPHTAFRNEAGTKAMSSNRAHIRRHLCIQCSRVLSLWARAWR